MTMARETVIDGPTHALGKVVVHGLIVPEFGSAAAFHIAILAI
jgi:hypothetical protein